MFFEAQAVYSLYDGKLPAPKTLTAEQDAQRERVHDAKAKSAESKQQLIDLKDIQDNCDIPERDAAPNEHYINRRPDQNQRISF